MLFFQKLVCACKIGCDFLVKLLKRCLKFICRHFSGWFIPYAFFYSLIAWSWYSEVTIGKSVFETFWPTVACPVFIRAPIILEVIKVFGFSTILIGWVYKSLDKQMLGLSYGELLNYKYSSYHACSTAHVCSTIICILSATANTSESAVISLVAVLYGFVYQWIVLCRLVLNPQLCENLAVAKWQEKTPTTESAKKYLPRLAGTIPAYDSEHYKAHITCFVQVFIKMCNQRISHDVILDVANLWSIIFEATKGQDELNIATQLINGFLCVDFEDNSQDDKIKPLNIFLSGYLVNQLAISSSNVVIQEEHICYKNDCQGNEYALMSTAQKIAYLSVRLSNNMSGNSINIINSALDCLKTSYCTLAWVYFQNGNISLSSEMLALKPKILLCDMIEPVVFCLMPFVDDKQKKDIEKMIDRAIAQLL